MNTAGGDEALKRNSRRVVFGIDKNTQTVIQRKAIDARKIIALKRISILFSQFLEPLCFVRIVWIVWNAPARISQNLY